MPDHDEVTEFFATRAEQDAFVRGIAFAKDSRWGVVRSGYDAALERRGGDGYWVTLAGNFSTDTRTGTRTNATAGSARRFNRSR